MMNRIISNRIESMFKPLREINGFLLIFIVNRLQIGFILLIFPSQLAHGYNLWIILLAALISQFMIFCIAKWLTSEYGELYAQGYKRLFSPWLMKIGACLGLGVLLIKIMVMSLGYLRVIQIYLISNETLFMIFLLLMVVVAYLMSYGFTSIYRFAFIAFLMSFWLALPYLQFYLDPATDYRDLLPLWSREIQDHFVGNLLLVLSAFSGPELLLFARRWLKPKTKVFRYMTIGNALTTFEYLFLYVAAVLFFTPNYLLKVEYPIVSMVRYLETPLLDRLEVVYLPLFLFPIIYSTAFMLQNAFYGTLVLFGKHEQKPKLAYLLYYLIAILVFGFVIIHYIWKDKIAEDLWIQLHIYVSSIAYITIPLIFLCLRRVKRRG